MNQNKTAILVAETDILTLEFIVANLIKHGFHAIRAKSTEEVYSEVRSKKIDCIILDAEFNENGSLEILNKLREESSNKELPALITCPKNYHSFDTLIDLTYCDLITKPLNYKELNFRIERIIKQSRLFYDRRQIMFDKDKLFSVVAHDLKKPFSSLLGMTQLLSESADHCTKEEIKDLTWENYKTVKSTYNLLENMLDWYKIVNGHVEIKASKFDLSKVCGKVIFNAKQIAFDKKISLISQVNSGSTVYADENLVYSVLSNLTENAIKFSPPKSKVVFSNEMNCNFQNLSVQDQGIGIDEDDIHKLFKIDELFTTPGTKNEKGCGFGLIVSKEIIEKNGGELKVESIVGKGSKFTFSLPIENYNYASS